MSTCMRVSQLITRPKGPEILLAAVDLAVRSARADIELHCIEINHPTDGHWWASDQGLFDGPCENDIEFRQMRDQSLQLLDDLELVERHHQHPAWVRFKEVTVTH
jgi:hypothetical protein